MSNKNLVLFTITILLAMALTACGASTSTTQEAAATTTEPTLGPTVPSSTNTSVPISTDTSAPQPTQTTAAETEPATATVSFVNNVLPIFESRCINCHGGERTQEGLDLKTYENLLAGSNNGSVLTPGNSDESLIVKQIVEGKMPKRGPKLTPSEVQVIIDWVNTGALNN